MSWWWILGALPIGGGMLVLLAMRGARIRARKEFDADLRQLQIDQMQGDVRRADEIEHRVEAHKKVVLSGDLDLSERLRRSGRSRPTGK